jgi:GMP synthase-like glutamine amidotransferase
MQALVKACGGNIISNPIKEIGWKDFEGRSFLLELTQAGINDPVFKGLAATLPIFHLHQETAKLTDNMRLLATGKHCKNQVVKVGKTAYGFQGHAELTESMLDNWLKEDDNLRQLTSEEVKRDYFAVREEYENNAKKIFTNFLRIADLL